LVGASRAAEHLLQALAQGLEVEIGTEFLPVEIGAEAPDGRGAGEEGHLGGGAATLAVRVAIVSPGEIDDVLDRGLGKTGDDDRAIGDREMLAIGSGLARRGLTRVAFVADSRKQPRLPGR
jgi:hypothetical protein